MRSPSIEYLHAKLEKHIRLTQSYTEIAGLEFIVKSCRLKPYDYVFKERKDKLVLYKRWFDEFGNSFTINRYKGIDIVYNDLSLDRDRIICTDLYYGLSLENVAKMSKLVHLVAGKDEDLYQDCYLLTFLGIDDHLRSYLYWYGEWQQVSPLLMGIKSLSIIAKHLDIKQYVQAGKKENNAIPCEAGETWLSLCPIPKGFIEMLSKHHEIIAKVFNEDT